MQVTGYRVHGSQETDKVQNTLSWIEGQYIDHAGAKYLPTYRKNHVLPLHQNAVQKIVEHLLQFCFLPCPGYLLGCAQSYEVTKVMMIFQFFLP